MDDRRQKLPTVMPPETRRGRAGVKWVVSAVAVLTLAAQVSAASEYVWWEAESPKETNFAQRTWFSPQNDAERAKLSGGAWLTNEGKRKGPEAFARYEIAVPSDGEYNFWARKFWLYGAFRWRFDDGEWRVCGGEVGLADNVPLRTYVSANWVELGQVRLSKGAHAFELRLLANEGEDQTCAFDCFLLIHGPFRPAGKLKPGEKSGRAEEGWFAWEPTVDPFTGDAPLDLRGLNEKVAGEHGFVRHDGSRFALGDGTPARFWAVNVGPNCIEQGHEAVDYLAKKLAKAGVNMVRCHGAIFGSDPARVDARRLDNIHYLVSALKQQGIYTSLSVYFPLWLNADAAGLPGFKSLQNKFPFALIYFEPRLQEMHRAWTKALLSTMNPYTGLSLARDPAVGIVEIVNEDSLFFWTFSHENIPDVYWQKLERAYGDWLVRRYGSLQKASAAWGAPFAKEDVPAQGRMALFPAWNMTGDALKMASPDRVRRIGDQVRFLTETQRRFYADTAEYFHETLGYGGLVSCSNWTTADPATLDAFERYSYTAGDVIDQHGYFGGKHEGEGASYSVRVGHTFEDRAAVLWPENLPIQSVQVEGFPQTITEYGWTNPNRFLADASFLAGTYGSLQGIGGIYFFAVGSDWLCDTEMSKFPVSCPAIAGTFPAAALMYRRGDVQQAPDALRQAFNVEDLFAMRGTGIFKAPNFDELRLRDVPAGARGGEERRFDPLWFYAGRVVRAFGSAAKTEISGELSRCVDHGKKVILSLTGELRWDYGAGIVTVNTPRCQGAAGFLSKVGAIQLKDVKVACGNEYAAVLVIALDGQPLSQSRKILVQAMTEEKPFGFRSAAGKISDLGGWPFNVRRISARISLDLAGGGDPKVIVLDENGYATGEKISSTGDGAREPFTFALADDALYQIVQR